MSITDADIVFRASERMTDFADGGGRMSATVVVDNVDNNVFNDITELDRLFGVVNLRKIYGACLSAGDETFLASHALLEAPPADPATDVVILAFGGIGTTRAEAVAALEAWHRLPLTQALGVTTNTGAPGSLTARIVREPGSNAPTPVPGMVLGLHLASLGAINPATLERRRIVSVALVGTQPGNAQLTVWNVTFDRPLSRDYPSLPFGGGSEEMSSNHPALPDVVLDEVRPYGAATTTSSSSGTSLAVDSTSAQVVPWAGGGAAYPLTAVGIDPAPFAYCNGQLQVIREGDALLIHHTATLAPQAASNGQTVNVGRTGLSRLRVLGNSGAEHFRFTRGQAMVGAGITADLDAGTVTFTDVSGLSQPVSIEHRIEEMAQATTVSASSVGINRTLSRTYPAGSRVSSLLMLGDLKARTLAGFAQQAWTGVWSDARIGGAPIGDYNQASYPIATTNRGGVTERWALIFNNTTSYRLVGESLGEVGVGSTGLPFSPTNPATGAAYVTINPAGFGAGWNSGNVYRFNSVGANAPLWGLRCVSPSAPSGNDKATVQLRGYVND